MRQTVKPLVLGPQPVELLDERAAARVVNCPAQLFAVRKIAQQHLGLRALQGFEGTVGTAGTEV